MPTKLEAKYAEALGFYADPDSYFAIAFFPDPPCGEFMDDFSEDHGGQYNRPMPGKKAREALFGKETNSEVGDYILKLEKRIERLEKALKPFAGAVYNDNGDVTITHSNVPHEAWFRAYKAYRESQK